MTNFSMGWIDNSKFIKRFSKNLVLLFIIQFVINSKAQDIQYGATTETIDPQDGFEICQRVSAFRQQNGLNPLVNSVSLAYTAEVHYQNLVQNNHDFFNLTCNAHSWYPNITIGLDNFCCYPQESCMGNGARMVTSNWPTPYPGIVVENIGYSGARTDPLDSVTRWINSPGHRAAMLFNNLMACGAMISNRVTPLNQWWERVEAVGILYMGDTIDPNVYRPPDRIVPTRQPTSFPTPPPTPPPTPYPTPPTLPPTPRPTLPDYCVLMEQICWNQCGRPLIFPFRERCVTTYDRKISQCYSPPGCTCIIPPEYRTSFPGIPVISQCQQETCNVNWGTTYFGSLGWCRACGYNCDGYQQNCIDNSGFCRLDSACGKRKMCSRWQADQCLKDPTQSFCSQTSAPTPLPTRQPTRWPTPNPTRQPTRQPTPLPTRQPTRWPTPRPTRQPTRLPTRHPTQNPTHFPTPNPTSFPTNSPTVEPTSNPTLVPNSNITLVPPVSTTSQPTAKNITAPTPEPTKSSEPMDSSAILTITSIVLFILLIIVVIAVLLFLGYKKQKLQEKTIIAPTGLKRMEDGVQLESSSGEEDGIELTRSDRYFFGMIKKIAE